MHGSPHDIRSSRPRLDFWSDERSGKGRERAEREMEVVGVTIPLCATGGQTTLHVTCRLSGSWYAWEGMGVPIIRLRVWDYGYEYSSTGTGQAQLSCNGLGRVRSDSWVCRSCTLHSPTNHTANSCCMPDQCCFFLYQYYHNHNEPWMCTVPFGSIHGWKTSTLPYSLTGTLPWDSINNSSADRSPTFLTDFQQCCHSHYKKMP